MRWRLHSRRSLVQNQLLHLKAKAKNRNPPLRPRKNLKHLFLPLPLPVIKLCLRRASWVVCIKSGRILRSTSREERSIWSGQAAKCLLGFLQNLTVSCTLVIPKQSLSILDMRLITAVIATCGTTIRTRRLKKVDISRVFCRLFDGWDSNHIE
jgi:hypothetical protein